MEPEVRLVKPRLPDELADHVEPPNVPEAGGSALELLVRDTDLAKHCCASTLCSLRLTSKALLQSVRPHCTRATWNDGVLLHDLGKYVHLQEMFYTSPWMRDWHRLAQTEDCEAELLRTCMTQLPRLLNLSLWGSAFMAAQGSLLSWQLPALISLSLNWSSTGFGDAGAAAVAIATLPALEELNLQRNCIGPKGATALAAGAWPSLHTLNLDWNRVGPQGAAALAAGAWPLLRIFSLDANCVEPEGTAALAAGAWPSLEILTLTGNRIGPKGAAALARTTGGWQLKELSLACERVADDDIIAALVQRFSRTLENVNFERCWVGDAGARAIAAAEWPCLQHLGLGFNDVGCDGAVALAACAFPALKVIELQHNPIQARGAIALAQAGGWPVLHTLRLPLNPELYTRRCHKAMAYAGWDCGTQGGQRFFCRQDNLPDAHDVHIQLMGSFDVYESESNTDEYESSSSTGSDSDGDADNH